MATSNPTFESQFMAFAKYGDTRSDGNNITLSQSDKWMRQAKVFGKKLTTTDTAISFNKLRQRTLNLADYNRFINEMATSRGVNADEIRERMTNCGLPGSNATPAITNDVVNRLTDTSQNSGSRKDRLDSSGRGRSAESRRETQEKSMGSVQENKEKSTGSVQQNKEKSTGSVSQNKQKSTGSVQNNKENI